MGVSALRLRYFAVGQLDDELSNRDRDSSRRWLHVVFDL